MSMQCDYTSPGRGKYVRIDASLGRSCWVFLNQNRKKNNKRNKLLLGFFMDYSLLKGRVRFIFFIREKKKKNMFSWNLASSNFSPVFGLFSLFVFAVHFLP